MNAVRIRAFALAIALVPACPARASDVRPDALLVVDQHREAIVERTIAAWPVSLSPERTEALRKTLWSLRADELLAVSLSPGDARIAIDQATPDTGASRPRAKALGDPLADLVYTPLTPCRIADTRNAVGALLPNVTRTLLGYHASSFAAQGGTATSCGIPNGVAALSMNVYAVNPSNLGFIKLWASNQSEPAVSTVNYEPPTVAIATGAIVPVNAGDNNKFNAQSPAGVHLVADVVGYFKPPGDANGLNIMVGGQRVMRYERTTGEPNMIGGVATNAVTPGRVGVTISGGGVSAIGCEDPVTGQMTRPCWNRGDQSFATIAGGYSNHADGVASSVGGGSINTTAGNHATVAGGSKNSAGPFAVVSGGFNNAASGDYSTIPGGAYNVASGSLSFAAGVRSKATHARSFVWGGDNGSDTVSQASGGFTVYAPGWVRMYAGPVGAGGCTLPDGTTGWQCASDRELKDAFTPVDGTDILQRLTAMPVTRWVAKAVPGVWHVGPTAQDFHAAFGLGNDPLAIGSTDAQGVAFAAIQGLDAKLESRLSQREREIDALRVELDALKQALLALGRERR